MTANGKYVPYSNDPFLSSLTTSSPICNNSKQHAAAPIKVTDPNASPASSAGPEVGLLEAN